MKRLKAFCLGLTITACTASILAQSLRDPTQAPADASPVNAAAGGKSGHAETAAMSVLVRDGSPFLVLGTRLYAQGQMLGEARIEKIGETEVLLREGGALRKLALFQGIKRQVAAPDQASPACDRVADEATTPSPRKKASKPASTKKPPAAPCAAVQP